MGSCSRRAICVSPDSGRRRRCHAACERSVAPGKGTDSARNTPAGAPAPFRSEDDLTAIPAQPTAASPGAALRKRIANRVGPTRYERYFESGAALRLTDSHLQIRVASPFYADWLAGQFTQDLTEEARAVTGSDDISLEWIVANTNTQPDPAPQAEPTARPRADHRTRSRRRCGCRRAATAKRAPRCERCTARSTSSLPRTAREEAARTCSRG